MYERVRECERLATSASLRALASRVCVCVRGREECGSERGISASTPVTERGSERERETAGALRLYSLPLLSRSRSHRHQHSFLPCASLRRPCFAVCACVMQRLSLSLSLQSLARKKVSRETGAREEDGEGEPRARQAKREGARTRDRVRRWRKRERVCERKE